MRLRRESASWSFKKLDCEEIVAGYKFSSAALFILSFVSAVLPVFSSAQENAAPDTVTDAPGCLDLAFFPKLTTSVILTCHSGDPVTVTMPLSPDAQGNPRERAISGAYEFREYLIPRADQQERAFENLMQLLPSAGFTVKYSSSPSTITARKENIWILFNLNGESYDVSAVNVKPEPWTPVSDAEDISREMNTHSRVAIYGIFFSSNNETVLEGNSRMLVELWKYLKANPTVSVVIESHKMTPGGNALNDLDITNKRAKALVGSLEAHGIPANRLQAKGLGRTMPITDNDTVLEIRQNERIVLTKAAQ
jgi:outer membrane protein OmpA-like peptidoglycan-associated protein